MPDVYQGTELWDLSLVDPDNRRPVDFDTRSRLLDELAGDGEASDGKAKMYVLSRALRHRRDHADLFARGDYLPVDASGARAAHLFAFARVLDAQAVLAVVPRLVVPLMTETMRPPVGAEVWGDTRLVLPEPCRGSGWRNLLTGEVLEGGDHLAVARVLDRFPVALLAAER
ncbi:MAG: hypothetical protein U0736_27105 [Gemmataceae bacterium]